MATLDEIRRELDKDELDYPALASTVGAAGLPELQTLVAEDEPRIASKAAYLAGLIASPDSAGILASAALSRHDAVRVAAAAVLSSLPVGDAAPLALQLLADPDPGVRARAARSAVGVGDAAVADLVRTMAQEDPEPDVRALADDLAREMTG